jgi:hypothetical protein
MQKEGEQLCTEEYHVCIYESIHYNIFKRLKIKINLFIELCTKFCTFPLARASDSTKERCDVCVSWYLLIRHLHVLLVSSMSEETS